VLILPLVETGPANGSGKRMRLSPRVDITRSQAFGRIGHSWTAVRRSNPLDSVSISSASRSSLSQRKRSARFPRPSIDSSLARFRFPVARACPRVHAGCQQAPIRCPSQPTFTSVLFSTLKEYLPRDKEIGAQRRRAFSLCLFRAASKETAT